MSYLDSISQIPFSGFLQTRRDLLNNNVEDGAFIGAVALRNLARISLGPVAFSGFNASRID